MRTSRFLQVVAGCSLLFAACSSGPNPQDNPAKVEALVAWIERVHVEAERSRLAIGDSFERLNTLAAGQFGKEPAATVYARFVLAIDAADEQARRFRSSVAPMTAAGEPLFVQWQKDLAGIDNERLRQRSQMRYEVTRQRYDTLLATAVPAQDRFDAYVKTLRDHAAFLGHDLNASALADIQDEVKVLAGNARELDRMMESSLAAARAYVENAALPATLAAPSR
jgi:hypothetical protein